MPARQLRLFEHSKPLLARLGPDFFKAVPACPGVYLMFNDAQRLLYVGQSSNLRARLGTYKNANPDHVPRKVLRLVHSVATIKLEPCDTALAARLRENELLRTHRPRFNRMHTWPKAYWFVGCEGNGNLLRLWLTTSAEDSNSLYGAFKGNTRAAFSALLRGLYRATSGKDIPAGLLSEHGPRSYELPVPEAVLIATRNFLAGTSSELLFMFSPLHDSLFFATLHAYDQELLSRFFEFGPQKNRRLCERFGLAPARIPQERLDELSISYG